MRCHHLAWPSLVLVLSCVSSLAWGQEKPRPAPGDRMIDDYLAADSELVARHVSKG